MAATAVPQRVSPLRRNVRYDVACRHISWLFARRLADDRLLGRLHACIVAVHSRWADWPAKAREGLIIAADLAPDLDREEYRQLAEGCEEDYVHDDAWYALLADLQEVEVQLAGLESGAVSVWDLVDEPHRDRGTAYDEAVAGLHARRDEALARLVPAGGGR